MKPQLTTFQNYSLGLNGFDILTTGSDTSGSWYSVQTVSGSCEFGASCPSGSNLPSFVAPANMEIYGWFDIINVTEGTLIAHKL